MNGGEEEERGRAEGEKEKVEEEVDGAAEEELEVPGGLPTPVNVDTGGDALARATALLLAFPVCDCCMRWKPCAGAVAAPAAGA